LAGYRAFDWAGEDVRTGYSKESLWRVADNGSRWALQKSAERRGATPDSFENLFGRISAQVYGELLRQVCLVNVSGGNVPFDLCQGSPVGGTIKVSREGRGCGGGLILPLGSREGQRLKGWIIGDGNIRQGTVHDKRDSLEVTRQFVRKETHRSTGGELPRVLLNPETKVLERLETPF
jgi:hypothetical protein